MNFLTLRVKARGYGNIQMPFHIEGNPFITTICSEKLVKKVW